MRLTYRAALSAGAPFESDDPYGDQVREFEERIGLRADPGIAAMEQMKAWYKATGREWDETPVTEGFVTDRQGNVRKSQNIGLAELNIEYSGMDELNKKIAKGGR